MNFFLDLGFLSSRLVVWPDWLWHERTRGVESVAALREFHPCVWSRGAASVGSSNTCSRWEWEWNEKKCFVHNSGRLSTRTTTQGQNTEREKKKKEKSLATDGASLMAWRFIDSRSHSQCVKHQQPSVRTSSFKCAWKASAYSAP